MAHHRRSFGEIREEGGTNVFVVSVAAQGSDWFSWFWASGAPRWSGCLRGEKSGEKPRFRRAEHNSYGTGKYVPRAERLTPP